MPLPLKEPITVQETKIPIYVGGYRVGPTYDICLEKRPHWLHRYMTRLLLGWIWIDNKKG